MANFTRGILTPPVRPVNSGNNKPDEIEKNSQNKRIVRIPPACGTVRKPPRGTIAKFVNKSTSIFGFQPPDEGGGLKVNPGKNVSDSRKPRLGAARPPHVSSLSCVPQGLPLKATFRRREHGQEQKPEPTPKPGLPPERQAEPGEAHSKWSGDSTIAPVRRDRRIVSLGRPVLPWTKLP